MKNELANQFEITVNTIFLEDQSNINENQYVFSYEITIQNHASQSAQLISRHWLITEATGLIREVKGLGVVGEQPVIKPNESYTYTSNTVLEMPMGSMHGTYQMLAADGTSFEIAIPKFRCNMPRVLH